MKILLVDPMSELEHGLKVLGHEVRTLRLGPGIFYLPGTLRRMGFSPDLLLQQERLGPRSYFGGLERLECPTVFWAIDSHLNMFWQQWYALLFDAVLTPHVSLFEALPADRRPKVLRRFAQMGQRRQWVPHERRGHALSVCARLDRLHRPVRGWLVDLLGPEGLHVVEGIGRAAMMDLYDDTRLVPNECIANEVNFRLLEGASSGCVVLSPDVGEDQNALLLPDKEFLVYHDGLELLEQTAWAKKRPDAAEAMGRAAMLRVQAEHLPEHRADEVARLAQGLTQHRLTGAPASMAFWITLALQIRNGLLKELDPHEHARQGLHLAYSQPPWQELPFSVRPLVANVVTQSLCLFAEYPGGPGHSDSGTASGGPEALPGTGVSWPVDNALALCRSLLAEGEGDTQSGAPPRSAFGAGEDVPEKDGAAGESGGDAYYDCPAPACTLELASAASAFALRQGLFSMALAFWARFAGRDGERPPRDALSLCLRWATAWERRGNTYNAGFSCIPEIGFIPENTLNYLNFARILAPDATGILSRRCAEALASKPALLSYYIGYLAQTAIAEPENWRTQLDYGLACLRACRVEAGLFEMAEACKKARKEGRERLFKGRVEAWRPGGGLWRALLPLLEQR